MKTFFVSLLLAVVLLCTTRVTAQILTTDKPVYEPGETVIITGSGFYGEEVVEMTALGNTNNTQLHFQTAADAAGNFTYNLLLPLIYEAEYVLTATGTASGLSVTITFLDDIRTWDRVQPNSATIDLPTGSTYTFIIRAKGNGNSNVGGITAVWTADQGSPSSFTSPPTGTDGLASYTHTVSTTAGTYNITAEGGGKDVHFTVNAVSYAPVLTCPTDFNIPSAAGQCGANVTFSASATGTPTPVITYSHPSGSLFPVGTTTVTVNAVNTYGTDMCTFDVTVNDNILPTITAPANIIQFNTPGQCYGIVTLGDPVTGDNCGVASTTNDAPSEFPIGTTQVTWTVTDVNGNMNTAVQSVTITDNEPPVLTGIAPVTLDTDPGDCSRTFTAEDLAQYQATDNCGVPTVAIDPVNLATGTSNVTWTVTDEHGNTTTVVQSVTIADQEQPQITAPAALNIFTDPGQCTATILSLGTPQTSDNCGVASVSDNAASLTFQVGTHTIVWTVNDLNGNQNTAEQTVTVTDNQPPTITAPAAIIQPNDLGICGAVVNPGIPNAADNCGTPDVTNDAPGEFPVGTTAVTWTATDMYGLTATAVQQVTINDNELPVFTGPALVEADADQGQCFASGVDLGVSASDNCQLAALPTNNAPPTFPVGETTVVWNVTDVNGNPQTFTQTVRVTDTQLPSITAPVDIVVNNDPGLCTAALSTLGNPSASDNCGVQQVTNDAASLIFQEGTTQVTWTVTDIHGNANTAVQNVTVNDTELPVIIPPAPIALNNDLGVCGKTVAVEDLGAYTATDNCEVMSVVISPTVLNLGLNTVTWTVTDIHNNVNSGTQLVTINDTELPTIIPAADMIVNNDPGFCYSANVILTNPDAADNCAVQSVTNDAPAQFIVGTTIFTWTVTDVNGNVNTAAQQVTVNDVELPVITAPAAITLDNDNGFCTKNISIPPYGDPNTILGIYSASDNCGIQSVVISPEILEVGPNTVTWTVTDIHGNENSATQLVTIIDDELPTITAPANIEVSNDPGQCAAVVSLGSAATDDNCGVLSTTNNAPASFPVGLTTVIWTVTDIHGNVNTASQTVQVNDTEMPTITAPANVVVSNDQGLCSASNVNLGSPVTSDNCGVEPATNNAPAIFTVGSTNVTWSVTDIHGNTSTAIQTVTVNDVELPSITPPAAISLNADQGVCTKTIADISLLGIYSAADNCDVQSVVISPTVLDVGSNTVTWTVSDIHNNQNSATQVVTIIDNQVPSITAPSDVTVNNDAGFCYAAGVSLGTPVTGDNCSVLSVTNDAPAQFPVGSTTVTWTVTDVNGNINTAQQLVTVNDVEHPVITGLSSTLTFSTCETVNLGTPVTTDNCGILSVTNNASSITFTAAETPYVVVWTVTDIHNNVTTFSQNVYINYGELSSFLPPMSQDPGVALKIKKGRTVPVKFRLLECSGTSNAVAHIYFSVTGTTGITEEAAAGTSAADIGNLFRYSASDDQYIFNLSTNGFNVNTTYQIIARLQDGRTITGLITVTK